MCGLYNARPPLSNEIVRCHWPSENSLVGKNSICADVYAEHVAGVRVAFNAILLLSLSKRYISIFEAVFLKEHLCVPLAVVLTQR